MVIKYNWPSLVNTVMRFSVKNGQLLKHHTTVCVQNGLMNTHTFNGEESLALVCELSE